jgi:hypothetical protein
MHKDTTKDLTKLHNCINAKHLRRRFSMVKNNKFLLAIMLFASGIQAQSLICMAPEEIDGKSESVTVLVKTPNAALKRIRIISEKSGKTSTQDMTPNKTYSINLKVETGENGFNVLGYGADLKLISGEICSVSVVKKEKPQDDASVESSSSLISNSFTSQLVEIKDSVKEIKEAVKKKDEEEVVAGSKHFRAVVGIEQVGASSSPSKQQPFFDFYFNTPLGSLKHPKNVELSLWGNARFASSPGSDLSSLSGFTPAGFATNFVQTDSSSKIGKLVQSFDFQAGLELQLFKSKKQFAGFFPGKSSISLIASAGATTPLDIEKGAVFYKVPKVNNGMDIDPRFKEIFPGVTTQKTIAFLTPERDRFLRNYSAGFRFKTHYQKLVKNKDGSEIYVDRDDIVPGMFDVTFGQNEAITNRMRGVILRLEGSLPIPIFKNTIYIFGSTNMRIGRNVERPIPNIFLAPDSVVDLSSADVFVVSAEKNPLFRSNRDTFRFGVGIDLLKLFKKEEPKK